MGFYINTDDSTGKVKWLVERANGKVVSLLEAKHAMKDPNLGVIVVIDNVMFEAAGFMFSQKEFETFTNPKDSRPKTYVVISRELAISLSGYKEISTYA
jgi:hypothetical protein